MMYSHAPLTFLFNIRLLEQQQLPIAPLQKLQLKLEEHLKWLVLWVLHYLYAPFLGKSHQIAWVLERWNLVLEL